MADKSRRGRNKSGRRRQRGSAESNTPDSNALNTELRQLLAWIIEHPGEAPHDAPIGSDAQLLADQLRTLQSAGWIEPAGDDRWAIKKDLQLLTGTVSVHPDGYGFVATAQQSEDVYLAERQTGSLLPGDRVLVRQQHDSRRNRYFGELIGILQRARSQLVGRVVQSGQRLVLMPDDPAISESFVVDEQQQQSFSAGSIVVARITHYPDENQPGRVSIERQLDDQHLAGMATEIATIEHDLPSGFSSEAIREAEGFGETIPAHSREGRKDLRELPLITIDGEDARDFDDAVYGSPSGKGWRLVVAIADVSSYVQTGSALDADARERGTSVYFPTRVLPMLPEALSNGLCSLMPEVDRLAMVCDMQLSADGKVNRSRFYPAVIRSHARLTYRQAEQILQGEDDGSDLPEDVVTSIQSLHSIWQCLDQQRRRRGALVFDKQESLFVWNADGTVEDIQVRKRLIAHRLIEEAMITANVEAAQFLLKQQIPGVLRVHPPPQGDKLAELERMLLMHNIKPEWHESPEPEDFTKILQQAQERPDQEMIEEMLLRAQSLAIYKPIEDGKTGGHFGLALKAYSHFTSPIRRYPDLQVHRALYQALDKVHGQRRDNADASGEQRRLAELAQHCSFTERRAERASRDVEFRLKCHYLKAFEGEQFQGWVTGVKNFGLFVELEKLHVSGLLHVSNMGNDYYEFDERKVLLMGRRTGKRFNLGDILSVRLLRVDIEQRKIDFGLE